MNAIPRDFADLLSPAGRRVLDGRDPAICGALANPRHRLIDLLSGESFIAFAEAIAGRKLKRKGGQQVLCYGPGDYAGPHNDHHPEDAGYEKGYLDIHLSLGSPAVAHQYLVYAKSGHFSEIVPVHGLGTLTVYRLPFWHLTTPLQAKPGREKDARRWVLLGTFGFKDGGR